MRSEKRLMQQGFRFELDPGKRPRLGDLKKQLVALKQTEAPWLYEVSAHIGQSALKDLDHAFERCTVSLREPSG